MKTVSYISLILFNIKTNLYDICKEYNIKYDGQIVPQKAQFTTTSTTASKSIQTQLFLKD